VGGFKRGAPMTGRHHDPLAQCYRICIRGRLGETICSAFAALHIQHRGNETTLTGEFADQAALYGVLAELEALCLELIEVRRLPPSAEVTTVAARLDLTRHPAD